MKVPNPNCFSIKCDHCEAMLEIDDGITTHFSSSEEVDRGHWFATRDGSHHCCEMHECVCLICDEQGSMHKAYCSEYEE